MAQEITNLTGLIDQISQMVPDNNHIYLEEILEAVGTRSLGPLLLLAGLITLAPIVGDIPGVPTMMGVLVMLVALQLLFRHGTPWLPHWILRRTIKRHTLYKSLDWSRKPARFVDRYTHIRLSRLVEGAGQYVIAGVCILVALAMPFMEFIPFSANGAGLALAAFGLALVSRDGVLALAALIVVGCLFVFLGYSLL